MTKATFLKKVLKATKKFTKKYYGGKIKKSTTIEGKRLQKMADLCEELGCSVEVGRELVELIIKKRLPESKIATVDFDKYCAIIPLKCINSHNYTLKQVAITTQNHYSDLFSLRQPSGGNNMSVRSGDLRPATEAEIKKFIKDIAQSQISSMF